MINKGVNLDGVETVADGKTFYWKGKYHDNMNQRDTLATELNTLENFKPIVPDVFKNAEVVLLGNLAPDVQMSVLEQLDEDHNGVVILDTMNFWMDIALDRLKEVIAKVDVITINDEEARQLSGKYALVEAAAEIHKMGPENVIIKKGSTEHYCFGQ